MDGKNYSRKVKMKRQTGRSDKNENNKKQTRQS